MAQFFEPLLPQISTALTPPTAPPEREDLGYFDVLPDAFQLENDMVALSHLSNKSRFTPTKGHDLGASIKRLGVWEDRYLYYHVKSDAELIYEIGKTNRERETARRIGEAGWAGIAANVTAGAVSPTLFFPWVRGATAVKSVVNGALSVAGGTATQEALLFADQNARSPTQAAESIAASALLGGVLGKLIHYLTPEEIANAAADMGMARGDVAISEPVPLFHEPSAAGAQAAEGTIQNAGKLKRGAANWLSFMSPVTRGIQQQHAPGFIKAAGGSPQIRRMTTGFSQAGLTLAENKNFKAASPGGNVEQLKMGYTVVAYDGISAVEKIFKEYILGPNATGIGSMTKARWAARQDETKLSWPEFKQAVSRAMWDLDDTEINPFIRQAAEAANKHVYDPLYDEATEVKIYTGEEKVVGDKTYLNRMYLPKVMKRRELELVAKFAAHGARKLQAEFKEAAAKLAEKTTSDKQFIADGSLPETELQKLREKLLAEQALLDDTTPVEVSAGVSAVKELRKEIAALVREIEANKTTKGGSVEGITALQEAGEKFKKELAKKRQEVKQIEEALGEEGTKYFATAAAIAKRLSGLTRSVAAMSFRHRKTLAQIEKAETQQIDTILRAGQEAKKFLALMDSASDAKLEEMTSDFKTKFAQTAEKFDKLEEDIVEKSNAPEAPWKTLDAQEVVATKLDDLAGKIEDLDTFDRTAWRQELTNMLREMTDTHMRLNARRAERVNKLWARAEKNSPEARSKLLKNVEDRSKLRIQEFRGKWAGKGDVNFETLEADFSEYTKNLAEELVSKLRGTQRRLAYSDIIQNARGPEMARMLDIPSSEIADFLELDLEKLMMSYTRTLGADIAIARVFGSPDAAEQFARLDHERRAAVDSINGMKDKKGNPLTQAAKEKLTAQTNHFYETSQKALFALLERSKGVRGLPDDPDSWGARGAKMALSANYLRFMGGVVISSISDPARWVAKHGVARTYRGAIEPMITGLKTIKMSAREARRGGAVNDIQAHLHRHSFNDAFDDNYRGTVAERGIEYLADKMGTLSGIDMWNQTMKGIGSGVINLHVMESLAIVNGEKATAKEIVKAQEHLARLNIDKTLAETIWAQVSNGVGGEKIDGIWYPNTENWDLSRPEVRRAQRAYNGALAIEANDMIVTPGLEAPLMSDANPFMRLLFQFRRFNLVSTQKNLMAGLQGQDGNYLMGVGISLALGYLSYYLYAVAAGGEKYDEMMKADWDKWTDEAISRSGVTAIFGDVQDFATRMPVIGKYATFSGQRPSRREGGDLVESFLGPSFDLINNAADVLTGLDEPTRRTLHAFRLMVPFNNLSYLRYLLDKLEDSIDLPERRQQ